MSRREWSKKAFEEIGIKGKFKLMPKDNESSFADADLKFKIILNEENDSFIEVEGIRHIYEEKGFNRWNWSAHYEDNEDYEIFDVCFLKDIKKEYNKFLETRK